MLGIIPFLVQWLALSNINSRMGMGSLKSPWALLSDFQQLSEDDYDPVTKKLLLWAPPYRPRVTDFTTFSNSTGQKTCGLGMLNLTYRQGVHLGLNVQPDAYYSGDLSKMEDFAEQKMYIEQSLADQGLITDMELDNPLTEEPSKANDSAQPLSNNIVVNKIKIFLILSS